jgi:hypothetical protein
MTRDKAIEMVGLGNVMAAESDNCEPTSRLYDHEDGEIEWAGSAKVDYNGLSVDQVRNLPLGGCTLRAIYYTDAGDAKAVEDNGGDWGGINWTVHHYEIA